MNIDDIRSELTKIPIFKNADPKKLAQHITEDAVSVRDFSAGDDICSDSDCGIPIGILLCGKASIYSADEKANVLLKNITDGAVFGIATLYQKEAAFPTRITAKKPCRVLFISPDSTRALIEDDKEVMRSFMTFLSGKIVYLNKKINSLTAGSAERKLSVFLAENAVDGIFAPNTSMSALASMLDIGRASLYRAFDSLEAEGFIERQDKIIIVKNEETMLKRFSR